MRLPIPPNVRNLFDRKAPLPNDDCPCQEAFSVSDAACFQGFDAQALTLSGGLEVSPRGGPRIAHRGLRQIRVGVKGPSRRRIRSQEEVSCHSMRRIQPAIEWIQVGG